MCGIAGVIQFSQELVQPEASLNQILETQHDRGPDYRGSRWLELSHCRVGLGHNRLSIIDLSPSGHQPMTRDGLWIVFNGEIYNYKELRSELEAKGIVFHTSSDTEVILAGWKHWRLDLIPKMNGMFALALLDSEEQKLWLVRDRFGIKPLHYALEPGGLWFASNTRGIRQRLKSAVDRDYLARGVYTKVYEDGSAQSPYLGIQNLPAATYLEIDLREGRLSGEPRHYFDLAGEVMAQRDRLEGLPASETLEEFQNLFGNAVSLRLRADVPVGVSVSGGLDSSSVVGTIHRLGVTPTGIIFGSAEERGEYHLAQRYARELPYQLDSANPDHGVGLEQLLSTIRKQDAPFSTLSVVGQKFVFQEARRKGIRVMLGGQGADEILAGYRKFLLRRAYALVKSGKVFHSGEDLMGFFFTAMAELPNTKTYLASLKRFRSEPHADRLFGDPPPLSLLGGQELWRTQMDDVLRTSLPTLLRYEDRNSMGESVESRLPYMDWRMVVMGLALPDRIKIKGGYGKWILRQSVDGIVPDYIRLKRLKFGFDVNVKSWIQNGLGRDIRSRLKEAAGAWKPFSALPVNVDSRFSDRQLLTGSVAMSEAIALLWLADVASMH